jgi:2-oxoglutarate/2-oxoacid ferredoxin oxidoreductase subunit beta
LAVAIALNASFVARAYCADAEKTKEIIKAAISHRGYALVDVLQPCVTFNKTNTYQWFKENTYYLEGHDSSNRLEAFKRAVETDKLPLGVFYVNDKKPTFEDNTGAFRTNKQPLYARTTDKSKLTSIIESMRS